MIESLIQVSPWIHSGILQARPYSNTWFANPSVGFLVLLRFCAGLETMQCIRPLRWPPLTLDRSSPLFPTNNKAAWLDLVPSSVR